MPGYDLWKTRSPDDDQYDPYQEDFEEAPPEITSQEPPVTAKCSQTPDNTFFVLMIDYFDYPRGRQSIVDPEQTRRSIVAEARDVLNSTDREIAFVYHFTGEGYEDITDAIKYEAQLDAVDEIMGSDRQAQAFDRERKLKAEYVA